MDAKRNLGPALAAIAIANRTAIAANDFQPPMMDAAI
jgi:hypothetical protein